MDALLSPRHVQIDTKIYANITPMSFADLLGGSAVLAAAVSIALLLSAIWQLGKVRKAAFYYLRMAARRAAAIRLGIAMIFLCAAATLVGVRAFKIEMLPPALLQFSPAAIKSTPMLNTATPTIAPIPTSAPTIAASKATIATTAEPTTAEPTAAETPTPAGPHLTLFGVADAINAKGQPVELVDRVDARTKRIHIFFLVQNAMPGVIVQHTWYHNAKAIFSQNDVLKHESTTPVSVSWQPNGGFEPGAYEVHLALNGQPQFIAKFDVR